MDTQYFSHDFNASKDPKLLRVRKQLGHAGIGLYWEIVELLYKNNNELSLADLDAIAIDLDTEEEFLQHLISDFGLFQTATNNAFFSPSIDKRIEKRKEVGKIRNKWRENKQAISEDKQEISEDKQEISEDKQEISPLNIKEKEKEKNNIIPPTPLREGGGRRKGFDFSISDAPQWVSSDMVVCFKQWIDYKRSRGQGYVSEDTAQVCYEKLVKLAGGKADVAADIVQTSIANNWHGLFATNNATNHPNNMVIDTSQTQYKEF